MTQDNPPPIPSGTQMLWQDGWYAFARKLISPNFGKRPSDSVIDLIIVHSISLPPGEFGGDEVQQLFTNRLDWSRHPYFASIAGLMVSAHFYVQRNGELWQFVSVNDRAWHAGESRFRDRPQCNDYSVGVELEGIEGGHFESAQYETLSTLCSSIQAAYPVSHVAGHEHVAPGRKRDPGHGFDWTYLRQSLGWPTRYFP
jgi:N-acetyl-anhydromuramoyl-L-alanine amidase